MRDPAEVARRAAELLDTEVTFIDNDAPPGFPSAGVSLADNTLALFPMVAPDECIALWGTVHPRPRAHVLAVKVTDLDVAAETLQRIGADVVRKDRTGIVLDPHVTGMVPLVITDGLLPGDPRSYLLRT